MLNTYTQQFTYIAHSLRVVLVSEGIQEKYEIKRCSHKVVESTFLVMMSYSLNEL